MSWLLLKPTAKKSQDFSYVLGCSVNRFHTPHNSSLLYTVW